MEEIPEFLRYLDSRHGRLDAVHILYGKVFRSGYMHFGFWPEEKAKEADVERLLDDLRSAQGRFAEELLGLFPPGPQRVLDVGAGLGRLAGEMVQHGHAVTAVTPCEFQAAEIAQRYPEVTVRHGRFQDIADTLPSGAFDIILFSESFRYVPLAESFDLFSRLLSDRGRVVIADWFAHKIARSRHGHDHNDSVFRETLGQKGFTVLTERDVTSNVAPTVKMAYDVLCELYLPAAAFLAAKIAQKWPRMFRFVLRRGLAWFERKIVPQLPGRCEPKEFAAHYRYFFFVLGRNPGVV